MSGCDCSKTYVGTCANCGEPMAASSAKVVQMIPAVGWIVAECDRNGDGGYTEKRVIAWAACEDGHIRPVLQEGLNLEPLYWTDDNEETCWLYSKEERPSDQELLEWSRCYQASLKAYRAKLAEERAAKEVSK